MEGDRIIACECGASLLISGERPSADRMEGYFWKGHQGLGHGPTWPRIAALALLLQIPRKWPKAQAVTAVLLLLFSIAIPARSQERVLVVSYDDQQQELRRGTGSARTAGNQVTVDVAYHVLRGSSSARVLRRDGKSYEPAGLIGFEPGNDHATMAIFPRGAYFTFQEMLERTRTVRPVMVGTYPLAPGAGKDLSWNQPFEAWLGGSFSVTGGQSDVEVKLASGDGQEVWNPGILYGGAAIQQLRLPAGAYRLRFDNSRSLITRKVVFARLYLTYFR